MYVEWRVNDLRLNKGHSKYDLRKYYFTNRVVNLPNCIVAAGSAHLNLYRLDRFRYNQDIFHNSTNNYKVIELKC